VNKLFVAVVACLFASGCETSGMKTTVPDMPVFVTADGKTCARHCQSIYASGNEACSQMIGGSKTAKQRAQCLDSSNINLSNCYKTCD
jgi:hypothetical protein